MIVYYAFKGSDGGFTFEYVAAIAQHTNIKALLLSPYGLESYAP